jgi:predicted metal-dependent hydrolase
VQLTLPFRSPGPTDRDGRSRTVLVVGRRPLAVTWVRHPRARHYLLRVEPDGSVRVTLPARGSRAEALRFVREKIGWIERERYRQAIERATSGWVNERQALVDGCWVDHEERDVPAARRRLRGIAETTLPARLRELARAHGFAVTGVSVRDQRSRWGSCSTSGRISLNWRLVQMPAGVRDYILLHELAHLHHPDHSRRFWRELERLCPWHREARGWLAEHGGRAIEGA